MGKEVNPTLSFHALLVLGKFAGFFHPKKARCQLRDAMRLAAWGNVPTYMPDSVNDLGGGAGCRKIKKGCR